MMSAQQQNMLGQMQLADKAREMQMNNALNAAYKNAYTAEGGLDTNVLRQKLAEGGFGSKLPELEKRIAELDEAKLFLNNSKYPVLLVKDLKLGDKVSGGIGLWVDVGTEGYFRDLKVIKQ